MTLLNNIRINRKTIIFFLTVCAVVMIVFALFPPFNYWTFRQKDLQSGLFADYGQFISGFLGSMVSLVTIILLYKTLTEQREQYLATLSEQRDQFLVSGFKTTFYSLLENHRRTLSEIGDTVFDHLPERHGTDFFSDLAWRIVIDFDGVEHAYWEQGERVVIPPDCHRSSDPKSLEKLQKIYSYHYHIYQSDLGHYFRNLYHFVRFIEQGPVHDDVKKAHIKILRAQLSNYEILLLAYNSLFIYGLKFKPKIESHELLKNLNFELNVDKSLYRRIVDPEILVREYPHLESHYAAAKAFYESQSMSNN